MIILATIVSPVFFTFCPHRQLSDPKWHKTPAGRTLVCVFSGFKTWKPENAEKLPIKQFTLDLAGRHMGTQRSIFLIPPWLTPLC